MSMNSSLQFRCVLIVVLILNICGCKSKVSSEEADRLGSEMIQALIDNNPSKARSLLKQGANPNSVHKRGASVLMASCLHGGYIDIANSLLKKGADPKYICESNDPLYNGGTALYCAAEQGNYEIVKLLLANGCDVNAGNKKAGTPIVPASLNGHNHIVEALLEAGADVNGQNCLGFTALDCAASHGNLKLLIILLDAGADPTIESRTKNNGGTSIVSRPIVKVQSRLYLRKEAEKAGILGTLNPALQSALQDPVGVEELEAMVQLLEAAEQP